VEFSLDRTDGSFQIRSLVDESANHWVAHARGRAIPARPIPTAIAIEELRGRVGHEVSVETFYEAAAAAGIVYGPSFRMLDALWEGENESLGRLRPLPAPAAAGYHLHPTVLDACFQTMPGVTRRFSGPDPELAAWLPVGIRRCRLADGPCEPAWVWTRIQSQTRRSILLRIVVMDRAGVAIAEIDGMRFRRVQRYSRTAEGSVYQMRLESRAGSGVLGRAAIIPPLKEWIEPIRTAIPGWADALRRADYYTRHRPRIEKLARAFIEEAIVDVAGGERSFSSQLLVERGQIPPDHGPLIEMYLRYLAERGRASYSGGLWELPAPLSERAVDEWSELARAYPDYHAELCLLHTGFHLADVLKGRLDPVEVLFSKGNTAVLQHCYESGALSRIYNQIAAAIVCEAIGRMPDDASIRILEVGAGLGGFTTNLLRRLPAERCEYWYTDTSETFVAAAEQKYPEHAFVRYARFDLDREPAEQGFQAGQFDFVLGHDVFHAARDRGRALAYARRMLAPGGLLLFIELQPNIANDVIFGPVKDWWGAAEGRGSHPLLTSAQWRALLAANGFEEVEVLADASEEVGPTQIVIAARKSIEAVEEDREPVAPSRWLVFSEPGSMSDQAAQHLQDSGHLVTLIPRPDSDQQIPELIDESIARHACDRILYGWGFGEEDMRAAVDRQVMGAMRLVHALLAADLETPPRIWFLTRGAFSFLTAETRVPAQAPLAPVVRVLHSEAAHFRTTLLDLHWRSGEDPPIEALRNELSRPGDEEELILSRHGRYVPQLVRGVPDENSAGRAVGANGGANACELQIERPGSLDSLRLAPMSRRAPGSEEVEIRVHAVGLNFRDIVLATGLVSEDLFDGFGSTELGTDCAGTIVAAGEDSGWQVGDEVIAFTSRGLASHIIAGRAHIFRKPAHLNFEEAAGLPTVAATVVYSLSHVARLAAGERILIHGAAGGVGLCAIEYARRLGAEVFATAGSPEKREYLRSLGVEHVFDSRTMAFAEEILEATGGEGVDVVLNSISGEAAARSLSLLRPLGRFIELGKRDFAEDAKLGMQPFRNNISYHGVDLTYILSNPATWRPLRADLVPELETGAISPVPYRVFAAARARDAFLHMQHSAHIGKIVISFADDDIDWPAAEPAPPPVRRDATYLVTGGLSGFGLATACWLADRGARSLVLVGRGGASTEEARTAVAQLERDGVSVWAAQADVTDEASLSAVLRKIESGMPPLRGIIHAAMVLDDGPIAGMTPQRFWAAAGPKMLGAWNLHNLTRRLPLDFFVSYSSISALFGLHGQANYTAGNAFMEGLAERRKASGLPALAVAWGLISGTGFAERNPQAAQLLSTRFGDERTPYRRALGLLNRLMGSSQVANACVMGLNWDSFAAVRSELHFSIPVRFERFARDGANAQPAQDAAQWKLLLASMTPQDALDGATEIVAELVARVLRTQPSRVDRGRSLDAMGMDSLMAVELQAGLESRFGVTFSSMRIMSGITIAQIAQTIVAGLAQAEPSFAAAASSMAGTLAPVDSGISAAIDAEVDAISEEQVDELLKDLLLDAKH
jgi:NADPH:quinone reductase-like Zn-dependent oxidoreductase/SAM-dependent methyltransferase/acyl carrier protein